MTKLTKFCFIMFLISLMAIPIVLSRVEEYKTTIHLEYTTSRIKLELDINGGEQGINVVNLPFSFYPKDLVVYGTEGILEYKINTIDETYIVSINKRIDPKIVEKINLEFEHSGSVQEIGGKYLFGFEQKIVEGIKKFEVLVKLPEGAVLANLTGMRPVSPEPDNIGSDGRHITLQWIKGEINQTEEFRIIAAFERTDLGKATDIVFLIVLTGMFVFILGATYAFFRKREVKISAIGLDKDEKKIYEFVLLKKETKQKIIEKELGFSKARLSKLIRNLDEKGLIEKKPFGRTNIIKIKK